MIHFPRSMFYLNRQKLNHVHSNHDREIVDQIVALHEAHPCYGYRRITLALRRKGIHCNKKKVQRLMKQNHIQGRQARNRYRKYSSYRGEIGHWVPNRMNRRFKTSIPH